jgi:hypothetical protein
LLTPVFSEQATMTFISVTLFVALVGATTLALVASAFSVAGAIFLIFELDHPFGDLIRIPSEPMIKVLSHLAK